MVKKVERVTKETSICVELNLHGTGQSSIATGIGFFDHMLEAFAKHSWIDLNLTCKGDTHIDFHHSVEIYNMNDMTAAHKTFPMNTMLKVTNLKNNKSIVVRINDRGPFVGTRIIDLSYLAATRLDLIANGTGPVGLEVIGFAGVVAPAGAPKESVVVSDYFVQIGAFRNKEGAHKFAQSHTNLNGRYNAVVKEGILENQPIYRVWLKGFASDAEADDFIAKGQFKGSFIVKE